MKAAIPVKIIASLRRFSGRWLSAAVIMASSGCALQSAYHPPASSGPSTWSAQPTADAPPHLLADGWWKTLGDPAIDALTDAALANSPTLLKAVARMDEARATLGVETASRVPTLSASANVTRARAQNTSPQIQGATVLSTSASVGPSLSWELDLFGRIRQSVAAARGRLDARTADAQVTRLSLAADVANGVLSLRACENSRRVLAEDITSRDKTLALTRRRIATGFAAQVDEARAVSGIATVRTNLATQVEQCSRQVNSLVALSGTDAATVRQLTGATESASDTESTSDAEPFMPQAPRAALALPATILAQHPSVISADREAAAAWAQIGVSRANRWPRLDLAAALSGQWIRVLGSNTDFTTWSVGPTLSGTLYDGGAGAANVRAAQARYRSALADLESTLRSTVQEVENALAAQTSADARVSSAGEAATAARQTLKTSEAQWEAGAIDLFELEDSRRQYASAQDSEISAHRDQAQAWITLVKATGGALTLVQDPLTHD